MTVFLESGLLSSDFSLEDTVTILTGGSGLLGSFFSEAILKAGGSVIVLDIEKGMTHLSHQNVGDKSNRFLSVECDITIESSVQNAH